MQFAQNRRAEGECDSPNIAGKGRMRFAPTQMCTVTYIPQSGGHFVLTSNRDENAARSPQSLDREVIGGAGLIFPRDTGAGGTWIAASDTNRVACVLNGAFVKHHHRPPYKRSRGQMVLDFFRFANAEDFFAQYDFEGIEPFTLILVDDGQPWELRWDEQRTHVKKLDPQGRYLWSSATLYPGEVGERRQQWFRDWLNERQDFSPATILDFHRTGGHGDDWNSFIMNRNGMVQTVSITQIVKNEVGLELTYNDLLRNTILVGSLTLWGSTVGSGQSVPS